MIYLRLAGGLGNQIFQLCAALALKRSAGEGIVLGADALRRYNSVRDLELRNFFRLPSEIVDDPESGIVASLGPLLTRSRAGRWLPFVGVNDRTFRRRQQEVAAGHSGRRFLCLDGYFQTDWNSALFEQARGTLESALVEHSTQEIADCAVHIRGGDFLLTSHSKIADADFYHRALVLLSERTPLRSIDVVTDDPVHANRVLDQVKLPGVQVNLATGRQSMAQDFERLRCARSRVIGNSTFSWWAAALDPKRALTVSPTHWLPEVRKDLVLPWELSVASKTPSAT